MARNYAGVSPAARFSQSRRLGKRQGRHHWKQWGRAGYRELRRRGVSVREAWNTSKSAHGPWRPRALALALPARYFSSLGCRVLQRGRSSIHRTAVYVTRSHGGVGGGGREVFSYPDA
jgi:hypothetical protein